MAPQVIVHRRDHCQKQMRSHHARECRNLTDHRVMIISVRLPHFATALAQQADPSRSAFPLVLGIPAEHPIQVYAACAVAAAAGISLSMSLQEAQTRCPELHLLPAAPLRDRRTRDRLMAQLALFTSQVEAATGLELRADARRRSPVVAHHHLGGHMKIIPGMKKKTIYLDLESLEDRSTLRAPELFLRQHTDKCVILDENRLYPELFPLLRSLVDRDRKPARFLVLGSANPSIIKGASESLAGRIAYLN